jgi:outer membrane receptor protein involved in Fe transport
VVAYLDLQESYALTDAVSLSLNVQNVPDRDPPVAPSNITNFSQTTVESLYDQIGRMFRGGVRFKI